MRKVLLLSIFLIGIFHCVQAQLKDPYKYIPIFERFESFGDSADIVRKIQKQNEDRLPGVIDYSEDYENFDNTAIHYSPRPDFSKKRDTTLIPLLAEGQSYAHPHQGRVSSHFGPRGRKYHYGTDLALYTGDTLRSIFDGIVRIAFRNRSYGNLVIVRHNNGLESYYAHMSKIMVVPDQPIKAGDAIGLGGSTGRSTGPHLHMEVRYLGAPIDPEDIINFETKTLRRDTLYLCAANFKYLSQRSMASQAKYHKVKSGETLSAIARKYQTSVANLCKLNKMSSSTKLSIGRNIRVR